MSKAVLLLDEKYNPEHCKYCTENCGDCMDAYKIKGGLRTDGFFRPKYDPFGYIVMRYAQKKCLKELLKFAGL